MMAVSCLTESWHWEQVLDVSLYLPIWEAYKICLYLIFGGEPEKPESWKQILSRSHGEVSEEDKMDRNVNSKVYAAEVCDKKKFYLELE